MARSLEERFTDIRDAATDLRDFVADMETASFHALPHADRMGFRAIKNALTEFGEAAKAIPDGIRARHSDVDWKGLAGLRDMVAHQYSGLDPRMLLPVIRDEIPSLLRAVQSELDLLTR